MKGFQQKFSDYNLGGDIHSLQKLHPEKTNKLLKLLQKNVNFNHSY